MVYFVAWPALGSCVVGTVVRALSQAWFGGLPLPSADWLTQRDVSYDRG